MVVGLVLALSTAGLTGVALSQPAVAAGGQNQLSIQPTARLTAIYRGSDITVWRGSDENLPHYYSLGDEVTTGTKPAPQNAMLVRDTGDGAVAAPRDYRLVFSWYPTAFFEAIPQDGYTCLGGVAVTQASNGDYPKPNTDFMRCVRSEYTVGGKPSKIWDAPGPGNTGSLWQANPADSLGLATSVILASPVRDFSGQPRMLNKRMIGSPAFSGEPITAAVARRFAPRTWLHPDELFFPANVEPFLQNTHNVRVGDAHPEIPAGMLKGSDYLVTNQDLGDLSTPTPAFLYGQRPDRNSVSAYAEIIQRDDHGAPTNITDIVYWMFSPYNRGKHWGGFIPLMGNHVGDWESMTIRFVDNLPYQIGYSQHDGDEVHYFGEKENSLDGDLRPQAFIAQDSHAMYPNIGDHNYKTGLHDYTGMGVEWDLWSALKVFNWQPSGTYQGDLGWLNIQARWGNQEYGCIAGQCRLGDGPEGVPLKGLSNPRRQQLGDQPLSDDPQPVSEPVFLANGKWNDRVLCADQATNHLWLGILSSASDYCRWTMIDAPVAGADGKFQLYNPKKQMYLSFDGGGNDVPLVMAGKTAVPQDSQYFSWGGQESWGAYSLQSFKDTKRNVDAKSPDNEGARTDAVRTRDWASGYQRELTWAPVSALTLGDAVDRIQQVPQGQDPLVCLNTPNNLRTETLNYVSAELGWTGDRYATLHGRSAGVGPWEQFWLCRNANNTYSLRAWNGLYVSAELGFTGDAYGTLRARAGGVGPWEQFDISVNGNGNAAIRAFNGKYVLATLFVGGPEEKVGLLVASSDHTVQVYAADQFQWHTATTRSGAPAGHVAAGTYLDRGYCLTSTGSAGSYPDGMVVNLATGCQDLRPDQNFTFEPDGTVRNNGRCLDDYANGGVGGRVTLWPCHGGPNQQWTRDTAGSLVNTATGKCLAGSHSDPTMSMGECTGMNGPNHFDLPKQRGDIRPAWDPRKCIDQGAGVENYSVTRVLRCTPGGSAAQNWTFEADGTIRSGIRCLDDDHALATDGNKIQIWDCHGDQSLFGNQQWELRNDGAIVNPATGKCLMTKDAKYDDATPLVLTTCDGSRAQQWSAPVTELGQLQLTAADPAKCLEAAGTDDGDAARFAVCSLGQPNQQWTLATDGTVRFGRACLDDQGWGKQDGNPVKMWPCSILTTANQQWTLRDDGRLVNSWSGKCLSAASTDSGSPMAIYTCGTRPDQWVAAGRLFAHGGSS